MRLWNKKLTPLLLVLCAAGLCACLELVRRTEPATSKPDPWWTKAGNPPQPEDVQEDTSSTAVTPAQPMDVSAIAPGPTGQGVVSARQGKSVADTGDPRTRSQEMITKQVNEYAYWCIEHDMWDEARYHLERAVGEDSLAASLFNNLGVVYERLGQAEQAESAYARATALVPGCGAYQANLRRLQERAEAAERAFPDSLESSDSVESSDSAESSDSLESSDSGSADSAAPADSTGAAAGNRAGDSPTGSAPAQDDVAFTASVREESSHFVHE